MSTNGAGGTEGGVGKFILGLVMFIGGVYLLLNAITVSNSFYFGQGLFRMGGLSVTSGMIMIPFMLGVGIIFYNYKNLVGWLISVGSLLAMVFGVISNTHFSLRHMSAFELIIILILVMGGAGLFLSSFKKQERPAIIVIAKRYN